jgi:hypothetical protein
LVHHDPYAEDVGLVDVVLAVPGVSVDHVGFPEKGREVLWGSTDRCGLRGASIFFVPEEVFALSEIYHFYFACVHHKEVGWL